MDKGDAKKEKKHKNKNRNRDAVEFVLANRDVDDPNYNNPDVNKKILLQVNKDEDLTEEQKKIINSIPKIQRGIFDEEAKLKRLLKQEEKGENDNNNNKDKKGVKFDFDKNEVLNFDKKKKVTEIENDKLLSDLKNNKIDLTKIEDEEKVNEIFKKLKVNAKMVEYNEFGLKKDTDPELLKFVTNKEFVEGVDIFVPAPRDNNDKIIKEFDTDMKEENMNEEFKELENELKSDSENENEINKNDKEDKKESEKKSEDINTSSKKEEKEEKKDKNDIEITGDLEDDFVLLANGGELPIEFLTEKEIKEEEKKKEELNKINIMGQYNSKPSYKYITPEEVEYVRKKFLEGDDDDKKKSQKKGNFISKQEFNDAINEILNSKKGKNGNKKETVMGLKKSVLDEDEYEEYELTEEEEEINDDIKNKKDNDKKEEEKKNENVKKNDKKNKIKDIISFKNEKEKGKDNKKKEDEEEDEDEDEEEEEDDEKGYVPNIKIEYVSKADEPDPFDKEKEKIKRKQRNKKEMKKSKTKQYEQLKAMGELSDESFDREQLDELVHEDELVEKTKEMIENNNEIEKNNKEVEQEIDKKYIFEPKVQKDITQTNDKVVNLPKAVKEERREKDRKNKKNEKEEDKEDNKKEENNQNMNVNHNSRRNETKEEKKLRQKLVKMEKKEKRAEKKKLKNAFKEEKISQQKQIAQTNKIVRYGLSIKDI